MVLLFGALAYSDDLKHNDKMRGLTEHSENEFFAIDIKAAEPLPFSLARSKSRAN